ncbi:uncharacterized protein [Bemisia tabaci]|uniref:uncharacterized protein n=1 Tax=Bemisia tabaci TaxID=7038 RepID=UPI003B281067
MLTAKQRRACAKCGHSSSKSTWSFHRIPKPGGASTEKCRQWASWLYPQSNWESESDLLALYKKSRVVCSSHFTEADFSDNARRTLRRAAVPHVTSTDKSACSLIATIEPPSSIDAASCGSSQQNGEIGIELGPSSESILGYETHTSVLPQDTIISNIPFLRLVE